MVVLIGISNRVNEQDLINSFVFQKDKGNNYLKKGLKKSYYFI